MVGDFARVLSRGEMILFPFPPRSGSRCALGLASAPLRWRKVRSSSTMLAVFPHPSPQHQRWASPVRLDSPCSRFGLSRHPCQRHDRFNRLCRDGELQPAQVVFTLPEGYSTQSSGRGSASDGRAASGGKKLIRFFDRAVNVTYIRLVGHSCWHLDRHRMDTERTRQTLNAFCQAGLPARFGWNQVALF